MVEFKPSFVAAFLSAREAPELPDAISTPSVTQEQPLRPDLLARAEILITLYGPLRVESGMNGCAIGVVNPETLVGLYHDWPWGIISTQSGVALMKWGKVLGQYR